MVQKISRIELADHLRKQKPITLVEALPEKYYADAHLPGAVRINTDEVKERAPALLPDKEAVIAVYCSNTACQNSTRVAHALENLGYKKVYKYAEGKQDWIEAGLETEK